MPPGLNNLNALCFEQFPYDAIELVGNLLEGLGADACFFGNDQQEVCLSLRFRINVDLQIGQRQTLITGWPAKCVKGQVQEGEMPYVDGTALVGILASPQNFYLRIARKRFGEDCVNFNSLMALNGFPYRKITGDEVMGKQR